MTTPTTFSLFLTIKGTMQDEELVDAPVEETGEEVSEASETSEEVSDEVDASEDTEV